MLRELHTREPLGAKYNPLKFCIIFVDILQKLDYTVRNSDNYLKEEYRAKRNEKKNKTVS
jgi:hypothetical protein